MHLDQGRFSDPRPGRSPERALSSYLPAEEVGLECLPPSPRPALAIWGPSPISSHHIFPPRGPQGLVPALTPTVFHL